MARLSEAVHAASPDTLVTFNHAYFVAQPEAPPPHIRNLSADIHHSPLWIGLSDRLSSPGGSLRT